jgi:DNA repair exonuclease SbcCD ATPase subunit
VGTQREATEATITEMESTLDQIKLSLPEQVRGQVENNLDQLRKMMADGLLQLADQNAVMAGKLEDTRVQLETANTRLEGIDQRMATSEDLSTMAEERRARIAGLVERFAALVDQIHEYDRTRLNCKECDEYLGLKKKKSGDLQTFHDILVAEIGRVQGELGQ